MTIYDVLKKQSPEVMAETIATKVMMQINTLAINKSVPEWEDLLEGIERWLKTDLVDENRDIGYPSADEKEIEAEDWRVFEENAGKILNQWCKRDVDRIRNS